MTDAHLGDGFAARDVTWVPKLSKVDIRVSGSLFFGLLDFSLSRTARVVPARLGHNVIPNQNAY